MIQALQKIVGSFDTQTKIKALTKMIPSRGRKKGKEDHPNFHSLPTISPDTLIEENIDNFYSVPKTEVNNLATAQDVGDWKYLLKRFDSVLGNLMRLLNNLRKQLYYKSVFTNIEEKEIQRRYNSLKEKLLEKTTELEAPQVKATISDAEKIEQLKNTLAAMGFTAAGMAAAGMPPPGAELDAATLAQVRASGADLIAAAHLATLEASSPQHVADVMQVILNRARGQSGGIPAVITGREQFTPYSAAIYGGSPGDPAASARYGHLKVTKAEIFQLASQPNGLQALTNRFNAGNPGVAAQVLMDIRNNGPLITSSRQFVGSAQYFTGYPKPGARRRPDGGNYYRDSYSSGSIILADLMPNHVINYDTVRKTTLLSSFIVDKPTIIDITQYKEPLIIIPIGRPIGTQILKMIFKKPFEKIENMFMAKNVRKSDPDNKMQYTNSPTPYAVGRSDISTTLSRKGSTSPPRKTNTSVNQSEYSDYSNESESKETDINYTNTIIDNSITPTIQKIENSKTNIDKVSQPTQDIFGLDLYLLTQTITAVPE